jgi:hypothetical protein
MRKLSVALAVGVLTGVIALPVEASKPKPVWADGKGDADAAQGLGASIPGGFDLVKGAIARNKKNLEFTVTHADMPPSGTLPEGFRFLWSFSVDGTEYRLVAKSADIGKPDAAQGQTTERVGRVDAQGHFRVEGDCGSAPGAGGVSFVNCKPIAYVGGSFDPGKSSFTIVVPMKVVKAKTGSVVAPGAGDSTGICTAQVCWVTHTAERSLSTTAIDTAAFAKSYKVPAS